MVYHYSQRKRLENPSQGLLSALLANDIAFSAKRDFKCPDCGAKRDEKHDEGCDIAQCMNPETPKYKQALSCCCGKCGEDVWTGLWPGTKECFEKGFVYVEPDGEAFFDMNRLSEAGNGVWQEVANV